MRSFYLTLATATILCGTPLISSSAPPGVGAPTRCFRTGEFQSWRAPNTHTLFIRVVGNRYYRLDLAGQCPNLMMPGAHLVTHFDNTNLVCRALDWQISVSGPGILPAMCFVKAMKPLTPAEVHAIPKNLRP
ncbi:MAG TPA: DUF6491 family protein [Steroidobacteraceae bacterium]|nr:DUF6491 family protein [Steroidobacteraceae bacterium]